MAHGYLKKSSHKQILETKQKKIGNTTIFCESHQFCVQQEALDQKFKKKSHTK